jgi:hypothetical protein
MTDETEDLPLGAQAERPHISWSQHKMFSLCGEQWRRRYVLGQKRPPGVAMIVGTGTHRAVETNMKEKFCNKRPAARDLVLTVARDAVVREWCGDAGNEQARGEAVDMATSLAGLHYDEVAPAIDPIAVECGFTLKLEGLPVDLVGVIDLAAQLGPDAVAVRDLKTAKSSPPAGAADNSDQLTCYSIAAGVLWPGMDVELALDHLIKTKRPKALTQTTRRTRADQDAFLRRVATVVDAMQKGIVIPAPRDSWACTPKWCGYFSDCPYVNAKRFFDMGGGE